MKELDKDSHIDSWRPVELKPASPNYRNTSTGQTALHIAAKKRNLEVIKLLLKRGADIAVKDYDGRTALHRTVERLDCIECGRWPCSANPLWNTENKAVVERVRARVILLIEWGADTGVRNYYGRDTKGQVEWLLKGSAAA